MTPFRPPADDSIVAVGTRLVDDARRLVHAEIALRKAELSSRAQAGKVAAIFLVAAILLLQATLSALLVGLILVAIPHVGPLWATAMIVVVSLLVIAGLAYAGARALGRVTAAAEPVE